MDFENLLNGSKKRVAGAKNFLLRGENLVYKKPKELLNPPAKFIKSRYAHDFIKEHGIPEKGERFFCLVSGSFIFGDLIYYLIKETGFKNCKLWISTLSYKTELVDMVYQLFDEKRINQFKLITSSYMDFHLSDSIGKYTHEALDKFKNVQVSCGNNHTKIALIQSDDKKDNFVIHGSANTSSSANMEQVVFENDYDLLEWNKIWMMRVHEKYQTIGKADRSRNLAGIFDDCKKTRDPGIIKKGEK